MKERDTNNDETDMGDKTCVYASVQSRDAAKDILGHGMHC